jgi:hypothetical protein
MSRRGCETWERNAENSNQRRQIPRSRNCGETWGTPFLDTSDQTAGFARTSN